MEYRDSIVHYMSDENIRLAVAVTRDCVETARQRHTLAPVACAALGRTMTGALLLAGDYKNREGVTIRIDGKGPLGVIHVDAFNSNRVRGYVDHPVIDLPLASNGKLDVRTAVGTDGEVTVTRFTPEKTTYTSRSPVVSGEIAEDLAYYLYTSEQIPATISLGVLVDRDYSVAASGGFLVQALPGAADDDLAKIEENIKKNRPDHGLSDKTYKRRRTGRNRYGRLSLQRDLPPAPVLALYLFTCTHRKCASFTA